MATTVVTAEPTASGGRVKPTMTTPTSPSPGQTYPQPVAAGPSKIKPKVEPKRKLLSTHILANPTHAVSRAISKEFPQPNPLFRLVNRFRVKHSVIDGLTKQEMDKWEKEGKTLREKAGWKMPGEEGDGVVVSELFWKVCRGMGLRVRKLTFRCTSHSCPPCKEILWLDSCPPTCLVRPRQCRYLSSHSFPTLCSIIAMSLFARKRRCSWQRTIGSMSCFSYDTCRAYARPSNSVNTITKSLKDLSAIVIREKRPKVVVKIMYDRGSWEQLWNSHAPVKPDGWTPLDLPGQDDIPGLEMEVIVRNQTTAGSSLQAEFPSSPPRHIPRKVLGRGPKSRPAQQ